MRVLQGGAPLLGEVIELKGERLVDREWLRPSDTWTCLISVERHAHAKNLRRITPRHACRAASAVSFEFPDALESAEAHMFRESALA